MQRKPMRRACLLLLLFILTFTGCTKQAAGAQGNQTTAPENTTASDKIEKNAVSSDGLSLQTAEDGEVSVEASEELPPPEDISVHLCAMGDIMAHEGTYLAAKQSDGSYDFTAMLEEIAPYTKDADYTFGNLETTFSGSKRGYSGYPTFNTPEKLADSLKNLLGVDLVSTANNHTLDKGVSGVKSTLDFLDSYSLAHTGSARSAEESGELRIADINGAKIAFLSYTYGSNTPVSASSSYCLNIIDKEKLRSAAQSARDAGADYVIALLHWGVEYKRSPSSEQKELAKWIFENTEINMIVGNHPHVAEPIEQVDVVRNGAAKQGIVFYALGNFTGAQRWEYTDTGFLADIYLVINPGDSAKNRVEKITYTTTYIDPNAQGNPKRYRVVSLDRAIRDYESNADPLISKEDYNKLVQYRKDYAELLKTLPIVSERVE